MELVGSQNPFSEVYLFDIASMGSITVGLCSLGTSTAASIVSFKNSTDESLNWNLEIQLPFEM